MEELSVAQIKRNRAMYLALSTLSLLFLGLIYAFSMFAAPMSQYFELEKEAVGLTFNIMMITFCIGAVVGSQIEKAMGLRTSLLVAAVMFLVGICGHRPLRRTAMSPCSICSTALLPALASA